jgi:hypothetical protein
MSQQLLLTAREQAEGSESAVRAAAMMHIARVLARSDEAAAVALLKRGLTLAKNLDGETAELLLNNAVFLAAAVSPRDAFQLYADQKTEREKWFGGHGSPVVGLANAMAQHGHIRELLAYFDDPPPGERFPLYFVGNLSRECPDDETRLKLLRVSAQAFRKQDQDDSHPHERQAFGGIFAGYWHLLPAGEARPLLLEIVHVVLKQQAESEQKSIWIGYPTPICVYLPKSNFAPVPKVCRSSGASPPFAGRRHLRNGVSRQPSLKRFLAPSCSTSAVRNAHGSRARKSSGRANAGITGIHSTLADYARDARINGNSPDVSSVEQCLRTSNGTWRIELVSAPHAIRLRKQTSLTASGYMVRHPESGQLEAKCGMHSPCCA